SILSDYLGGNAAKVIAPPGQGAARPLRGPEGQSPSAGSGAEPREIACLANPHGLSGSVTR
ncbi:MAG: hypothetical protein ACLUPV_13275, partial [Bilophila wadsworthia]